MLTTGNVPIARTTTEQVDEFNHLVREYRENRAHGNNTISVTLRMNPETVDALRYEARRRGLRGYQTLMNLWIEERLVADDLVEQAVIDALEPVRQLVESRLAAHGVEART